MKTYRVVIRSRNDGKIRVFECLSSDNFLNLFENHDWAIILNWVELSMIQGVRSMDLGKLENKLLTSFEK